MRLDGKVAVITGGASGIGEATVRLFAEEGARVVAGDVQEAPGEALAEELGDSVRFVRADVSQEADVRRLVNTAVEAFGGLDCSFNNAGVGGVNAEIQDIDVEAFDATVAVLLRGVFLGMKHAIPAMRKRGGGSIISTASVAGVQGGFGPLVYSTCKAAVVHLSRTAAIETGRDGIRINAICPGGILTPILTNPVSEMIPNPADASQVVEGFLKTLQPVRRAGRPADIAETALWLASDAASFVTGQAIVVDGGLTAGRMRDGGSAFSGGS